MRARSRFRNKASRSVGPSTRYGEHVDLKVVSNSASIVPNEVLVDLLSSSTIFTSDLVPEGRDCCKMEYCPRRDLSFTLLSCKCFKFRKELQSLAASQTLSQWTFMAPCCCRTEREVQWYPLPWSKSLGEEEPTVTETPAATSQLKSFSSSPSSPTA